MAEPKESRSVERTLAIFEAFGERKRPLTLRELASCGDIPVSTCHFLVHTLLNRAYLYQTSRRKELYPTRRLLDLAANIVAHDPFIERMTPAMDWLRNQTKETVILGKRQKDNIIYLEVLESPQTIRYSARAGQMKPLHSTCIGKVILSGLTPAELSAWIRTHQLTRVTSNTITTQRKLVAVLKEGSERGYFITRGENVSDVTAIAVPLHINNELLGLAVAGPSHRMESRLNEHLDNLFAAQQQLRDNGLLP